jgi:hypothetical protein
MAPISNALRSAIEIEGPGLSCKLACGFPCWRGTERILSIAAHKRHCNLQLWSGARLAATFPNRIEGTGKALRHAKLRTPGDVDNKVRAIIQMAIKLDLSSPQQVR